MFNFQSIIHELASRGNSRGNSRENSRVKSRAKALKGSLCRLSSLEVRVSERLTGRRNKDSGV